MNSVNIVHVCRSIVAVCCSKMRMLRKCQKPVIILRIRVESVTKQINEVVESIVEKSMEKFRILRETGLKNKYLRL